jgi:hypothetical protein
MAARADKKPFGYIAILFENVVEAVFISTLRTILKLVFELDLFYFSIHFLFPHFFLIGHPRGIGSAPVKYASHFTGQTDPPC